MTWKFPISALANFFITFPSMFQKLSQKNQNILSKHSWNTAICISEIMPKNSRKGISELSCNFYTCLGIISKISSKGLSKHSHNFSICVSGTISKRSTKGLGKHSHKFSIRVSRIQYSVNWLVVPQGKTVGNNSTKKLTDIGSCKQRALAFH